MLSALTPKGRKVLVKPKLYGTSNIAGHIFYHGVLLSSWQAYGCGFRSIDQALERADKRIDELGLTTD